MIFIYNLTDWLSIMKGFISLELVALAHLKACCASGAYSYFCHL